MNDAISFIFGLAMLVGICWLCIQAGLLTRGAEQGDTPEERAEDDARFESVRAELDVQEMKPRKVRCVS